MLARYLFQGKVRGAAPCPSDPSWIQWIKQFVNLFQFQRQHVLHLRVQFWLIYQVTQKVSQFWKDPRVRPERAPQRSPDTPCGILRDFLVIIHRLAIHIWYFFFFQDNFLYCSLFRILKYSINSKYMILSNQWTSLHPGFVRSHRKAILERTRISENEELLMLLTLFECKYENKKKWRQEKKMPLLQKQIWEWSYFSSFLSLIITLLPSILCKSVECCLNILPK